MNKTLRYSLLMLFALISSLTFAGNPDIELTFPGDNKEASKVGAYNKTWTCTKGEYSWSIINFNNNNWGSNWTYIKCGSKNNASIASITNTTAFDKAIENVVLTINKVTADKVNSITLTVTSDAEGTQEIETVNAESIAAGDYTFKLTNPTANSYYKLTFDCQQGSSNGLIEIGKIKYYAQGNAPVAVDITNTPETAYTVAKAIELIEAGEGLQKQVYVKGYITNIDDNAFNLEQGYATYYIGDTKEATQTMQVYKGKYLNNENFTAKDQIKVGDEVIVYGKIKAYGNTNEFDEGNYIYSTTTGITTVQAVTVADNETSFNLAGQKVNATKKGVVIKNGKKFIQK